MAWVQTGNGVKFEGETPYDYEKNLETDLDKISNEKDKLKSLSPGLSEYIKTYEASKDFITHLSKWCYCQREERAYLEVSEYAITLANRIFFGDVCPRLSDKDDKPMPEAEEDYTEWVERLKKQSRATEIIDDVILGAAVELEKAFKGKSPLHFPEYQNNADNAAYDIRVSEQESKMVLAKQFFDKQIPFAVEAPTPEKYGVLSKSGRYDLLIYKENVKDEFEWAIELKAHNPSPDSIRNDFIKLMDAKTNCLWFLTLRNADENTYKRLLKKVNEVLLDTKIKENYKFKIAFVNLEKGELRVKDIYFTDGAITKITSIDDFKSIDLKPFINGQREFENMLLEEKKGGQFSGQFRG